MDWEWRVRKKGCWRSGEEELKQWWERVFWGRCFSLNLRGQTLCVCVRWVEEEGEGLGMQV